MSNMKKNDTNKTHKQDGKTTPASKLSPAFLEALQVIKGDDDETPTTPVTHKKKLG